MRKYIVGLLLGVSLTMLTAASVRPTSTLASNAGLPKVIAFVQELDARVSSLESIPQPGAGSVNSEAPGLTVEEKRQALLELEKTFPIHGDVETMPDEMINTWYEHFTLNGMI